MSDKLFLLVAPIYRYVLEVVEGAARGTHPALVDVQRNVVDRLDQVEAGVKRDRDLVNDWELIESALIYWIDEMLVNSQWDHRVDWEAEGLEWQRDQVNLRAHRYYESAQVARDRERTTEALELFLLGLSLGFRGEHRYEPRGMIYKGQNYYKRYRDKNALEPFGTETKRGRSLEPLPGPTVLLVVSALVLLTALVTLAGFWATHPPSFYHA